MAARLEIHRNTDDGVDRVPLKAGTNRVQVQPGQQFRLHDPDGQLTADTLRVLQIDTDMIIDNIPVKGSAEPAHIVLEGYYRTCSAADRCEVMLVPAQGEAPAAGEDEGEAAATAGQPVLLADVTTTAIGALSDGAFVLHDTSFRPAAAPEAPTTESMRPVLYGLGGAAVLGLALGGGGGGGGDGAPATGDIPLALKSANVFNNRFPTISGSARQGTEVQLRIDTDGDLRENVTYTTTADAAGNWSVSLRDATPTSGALPASGLADSNSLSVIGTLNGVQNSLPLTMLTFDNVAPARAEIASVAGDGIITGPEKTAGASISGTAEPGGTVEVTLGTTTKQVAVAADGKWETTLTTAELPANDGEHTMSVTTVDAAGNRAPAAEARVVLDTTGTAVVIGRVANNDVINAAEATNPVAIRGTAEAGATVQLTLGTAEQTVTAGADGAWSAELTLPASVADGRLNISAEATSPNGNKASASRAVTLDRTAPASATNISIDDGNVITHDESRDGTTISGRAEAGSTVSVAWNNHTETATVGSDGQWQVSFRADQLPVPASGTAPGTIAVSVQDAARNTSGTVDTPVQLQGQDRATPPTINAIASDNVIDTTEATSPVTVSGNAQAGAVVALSAGGQNASATAGADGKWSTTMNLGTLANGNHTLSATATVEGGTASTASTQSFQVDKTAATPPTPPAPPTTPPGTGTGAVSALSISGDGIVTTNERGSPVPIRGSAPANTRVTVSYGGASQVVEAGSDGIWNADIRIPQSATAGEQTVSLTARDGSTTVGTGTATFNLLPHNAVSITAISGDGIVSTAERANPVPVVGTAAPNSTVTVHFNVQAQEVTADANGNWTANLTIPGTMPAGTQPVIATATTGSGTAARDSSSFTLRPPATTTRSLDAENQAADNGAETAAAEAGTRTGHPARDSASPEDAATSRIDTKADVDGTQAGAGTGADAGVARASPGTPEADTADISGTTATAGASVLRPEDLLGDADSIAPAGNDSSQTDDATQDGNAPDAADTADAAGTGSAAAGAAGATGTGATAGATAAPLPATTVVDTLLNQQQPWDPSPTV